MVLTKKAYLIRDDEMVEIDKDDFIIGRANHLNLDLNIQNNMISRLHCRITKEHDYYYVEDLQAMNGTYINNERLIEKTRIEDGQTLTFADVSYIFRII